MSKEKNILHKKESVKTTKFQLPNKHGVIPSLLKPNVIENNSKLLIGLFIAILGFIFYANTLHHNYAFDDFLIIKDNLLTHKGAAGIKEIFSSSYYSGYFDNDHFLYRPLSKAMFAFEWQFAPNTPRLSHWINVVLYAITGFLLFRMLLLYFPDKMWFCAITSVLFIIHPIHTEVIANIKSRDELLCFLFFLLTAISSFNFVSGKKGSFVWLFASLLFFSLSLFSKESSITFLAVIPLMMWFFNTANLKKQLVLFVLLCAVVVLFLILRSKILGTGASFTAPMVDNILLFTKSHLIRFCTAIFIFGIYLKLLFFPYPLTSDNSYNQIPLVGLTDWHFILSFLIFTGLGIYALWGFRKKSIYSFGILFFFITFSVTSNIFILIGTSYGERFMYTPSLGFCMVISSLLMNMFHHKDRETIPGKKLFLLLALITLFFFVFTFKRNKAWKDDYALHTADVLHSPNSAKAHYFYGNVLTEEERLSKMMNPELKQAALDEALKEMRKTISIYPLFADAFDKIGNIYFKQQKFDSADFYFNKALSFYPENVLYLNNYGISLFYQYRMEEARLQFERSLKIKPYQPKTHYDIALVYGVLAQQSEVLTDSEKAKRYYKIAISHLQKCVKPQPYYAQRYYMMGVAYQRIGDKINAQYYLDTAKSLNPTFK
jgi:tetratricopeptide (TPR) repeat protein